MTDEELQQQLQEATEEINTLSDPEKTLAKDENKRKRFLLMKQDNLKKIKEAREKGNTGLEYSLILNYGVLTSLGEKHPFLMMLVRSKFGVHI